MVSAVRRPMPELFSGQQTDTGLVCGTEFPCDKRKSGVYG